MLITYKDLPKNSSFELWTTDAGAFCQVFPPDPNETCRLKFQDPPTTNYRHTSVGTEINETKFLAYYHTMPEDFVQYVHDWSTRVEFFLSNPVDPMFWHFASSMDVDNHVKCFDGLWKNIFFRVFHFVVTDTKASTRNNTMYKMNKYFAFAADTDYGKNLLMQLKLMFG